MSIYCVSYEDDGWSCFPNPSYEGKLNDPRIDTLNYLFSVRVYAGNAKDAFNIGFDIIIKIIESNTKLESDNPNIPPSFRCDVCDSDKVYFVRITGSIESEALSYVPVEQDDFSLVETWVTDFTFDSKTLLAVCLGCEKTWGPTVTLKDLEKIMIDNKVII
jgi:hypothetical protein